MNTVFHVLSIGVLGLAAMMFSVAALALWRDSSTPLEHLRDSNIFIRGGMAGCALLLVSAALFYVSRLP